MKRETEKHLVNYLPLVNYLYALYYIHYTLYAPVIYNFNEKDLLVFFIFFIFLSFRKNTYNKKKIEMIDTN